MKCLKHQQQYKVNEYCVYCGKPKIEEYNEKVLQEEIKDIYTSKELYKNSIQLNNDDKAKTFILCARCPNNYHSMAFFEHYLYKKNYIERKYEHKPICGICHVTYSHISDLKIHFLKSHNIIL